MQESHPQFSSEITPIDSLAVATDVTTGSFLGYPVNQQELEEKQREIFEPLGINSTEASAIMEPWKISRQEILQEIPGTTEEEVADAQLEVVELNMRHMQQVDQERPGAARMLYEEYGIRQFGRYEVEDLVQQADRHAQMREGGPTPSKGVAVSLMPAKDAYGAFLDAQKEAQHPGKYLPSNPLEVFMGRERTPLQKNPIITEALTPLEAFQRLLAVKHRFGGVREVAIYTHGGDEVLGFTGGQSLDENSRPGVDYIDVSALQQTRALNRLMQGNIAADFVLIMAACESQQFAKEASAQTGGRAYFAGQAANAKNMVSRVGNRVAYVADDNVLYAGEYHAGELVRAPRKQGIRALGAQAIRRLRRS